LDTLSLPEPVPGLIIPYSFLWSSEAQRGQEEGAKYRPCAIAIANLMVDGRKLVRVLPITHRAPRNPDAAIEIPLQTKRRLGLDHERSWIILDDVNDFVWPGPDLRAAAMSGASTFVFGVLPPALLKMVLLKLADRARQKQLKITKRTE
jgi:hypothetical protein